MGSLLVYQKYLHLLYGRHLHKLEEMIDYLEND